MKIRWILAAAGAVALGLLTLSAPWSSVSDSAQAANSGVCDPHQQKAADLNFTLKDLSGKDVHLASYRGKVILLDFWATWCGPCKLEIPNFTELQAQYGAKGLQVIGVSVDDTVDKLLPFAAQFKMNYPILQGLGHDDLQDAFGPIVGIPTTIVISRDAKVCTKHIGVSTKEAFEKEIKALL